MSAPKRKKIVFVCTGNTCRSPMAELLLKRRLEVLGLKGYTVTSAGIKAKRGDGMNPKSAQVLIENGIDDGKSKGLSYGYALERAPQSRRRGAGKQRLFLL